jgi:hypothetical protein
MLLDFRDEKIAVLYAVFQNQVDTTVHKYSQDPFQNHTLALFQNHVAVPVGTYVDSSFQ